MRSLCELPASLLPSTADRRSNDANGIRLSAVGSRRNTRAFVFVFEMDAWRAISRSGVFGHGQQPLDEESMRAQSSEDA
jgi:hypothetical protein